MDPLTIASLVSAGSGIAGSLFNQGPDTPDFVNPAIQAARRRRRAADRTMNRRSDRLEADIAASGMSGSGAAAQRESLYRANNDLQSNLDARLLDSINQARQQQEMAEYQAQRRKSAARAQAIGNLSGVAGMFAANQFAGGEEQPEASQSVDAQNPNYDPWSSGSQMLTGRSQNPIFGTQTYRLG